MLFVFLVLFSPVICAVLALGPQRGAHRTPTPPVRNGFLEMIPLDAPEPLGEGARIARPLSEVSLAIGLPALAGGACLLLGGLAGAPDSMLIAGAILTALGALRLGGLHPGYAVGWTAEALRGPTSYLLPPGGRNAATIAFAEIETLGVDWRRRMYARTADGRIVRWSAYHAGWAELMDAIAEARPDLLR